MSAFQLKPGIAKMLSVWRYLLPRRTALAVHIFALVFMGILWLTPAINAQDPFPQDPFPIEIGVRGAEDPGHPMLVAEGGWPLTIELSLNDSWYPGFLFFGGDAYPTYPLPQDQINSIQSGAVSIVLFSNPDGIVNPEDPQPKPPEYYCLSFLEDYFGTADTRSFRKELLSQVNHMGCPSRLSEDLHLYFALGTEVGAAAIDWPAGSANYPGWAYDPTEVPNPPSGRSLHMPGLVILSDSGMGNIYKKLGGSNSYVLKSPRAARNLAAYINSVGYLMRSSQGNTVITASWIAPRYVISPYIERDSSIGLPCNDRNSDTALRINGSQQLTTVKADKLYPAFTMDSYLLDNYVATLRIFVVNGPAPDELKDSNCDGQVDYQDALEAGYQLLSEEKTISLRVLFQWYWGSYVDLDANGCIGGFVLPAGAGGLGRIPQ